MSEPRCLHTVQVMDDGSVIVIGGTTLASLAGEIPAGGWTSSVEIYKENAWKAASDLPLQFYAESFKTQDNRILLAGADDVHYINYYSYSSSTNSWTRIDSSFQIHNPHKYNIFQRPDYQLDIILDPFTESIALSSLDLTEYTSNTLFNSSSAKLQNPQSLTTGGTNSAGYPSKQAYLIDPSNPEFSSRCSDMNLARAKHQSIALSNQYVLVMGGTDENGQITATCELYDLTSDTWRTVGNMNFSRQGLTATLLDNGMVLVAGGVSIAAGSGYQVLDSTELYDPITEQWTLAGNMSQARAHHVANKLSTGEVIVTGGFDNDLRTMNTVEAFTLDTGAKTLPA